MSQLFAKVFVYRFPDNNGLMVFLPVMVCSQGLFLADSIAVIQLFSQRKKVSFFFQFLEEISQFQVGKKFKE